MNHSSAFRHAAELLRQADGLVIAAGAGLGVDSGLPDFRGNEGFWRAYPALGHARLDFTEVASPATFRRDPALAWGFYGHRLELYRRTRPHAGFGVLQRWAERMPQGAFVFTSNVDGQFQQAGFDPQQVHECHGSIHWLQCLRPCGDATWDAGLLQPEVDAAICRWRGPLPACPGCGGLARPNLLMFDDSVWNGERYDTQARRLAGWLATVRRPLVVEIGAGTQVPSVRHFSRAVLRLEGARLLRINPREPQVSRAVDLGLALGAREALLGIEAAWPLS